MSSVTTLQYNGVYHIPFGAIRNLAVYLRDASNLLYLDFSLARPRTVLCITYKYFVELPT
jgi:hypothetical protein